MRLITHHVTNQSEPLENFNLFSGDAALVAAVRAQAKPLMLDAQNLAEELTQFGAVIGTADYFKHAQLLNNNAPQLQAFDSRGRRLDQVEFHPSWHHVMSTAIGNGLHTGSGGHLLRAAKFLMHSGIESSALCPVSMTYAVAPAVDANPSLASLLSKPLASRVYDPRPIAWQHKTGITMGMGMTEKQGGSDVRANTTRAESSSDGSWRITGHKWFFSAPMSDAFLVLAQTSNGLSCFFVPSYLSEDAGALDKGLGVSQRNAIEIQRLKSKLGNRGNASSEVEFNGAWAQLVGDEGRGISTILEMGTITRIDCALGTAGLMRQGAALALDHASQRQAFGKKLIDQPLMRNTLADLAIESEASTALAIRLAATLDRPNDAHEQGLRRLLTPAAKLRICKRGSALAQEAMECLGGNGYVEEGRMAAIYREMPLNSIWEGAGNIMAIDLLRGLRKGEAAYAVLEKEIAPSRGRNTYFDDFVDRWFAQLKDEVAPAESQGRVIANNLAMMMQGHLLLQHSDGAVAQAFCVSRLNPAAAGASAMFGLLSDQVDCEAIVDRAAPR